MARIIVVLLVLYSFSLSCAFGQDSENLFTQVIPPSPDASSLGKFADIPVGLYNGIPNISIPLYEVSLKGVKVPVSLNYHAGGIRVAEIPSLVGLGWALNAGGTISRTVHGNPDEKNNGYLNADFSEIPISSEPITGAQASEFCYRVAVTQEGDTEPDMYYFNFAGISGKFVLDRNYQAHTIPHSKVRIKPTNFSLSAWEITTEDGTKYFFNQNESSLVTPNPEVYFSTWYLSEIQLPNSSQKIRFEYDSYSSEYRLPVSETKFELKEMPQMLCPPVTENGKHQKTYSTTVMFNSARLRKIIFPTGEVEFVPGNYRFDFKGGQVLDEVIVRNGNHETVKRYKLNYQYFTGAGTFMEDNGTADANTSPRTDLRLFLKNVQELSNEGGKPNPPYSFQYYTKPVLGGLPDRLHSMAQDHWGFYNGEINNTTLIPAHEYNGIFYEGASRQAVEEYAKIGTLNKINYPTGGYTNFIYELNEAESDLLPDYREKEKVKATFSVGYCHASNPVTFEINDEVTQSSKLNISLSGGGNPEGTITCTGGKNKPLNSEDEGSYIYFKIVDITNPNYPQQVYLSSGSFTVWSLTQPSASKSITLPNGTYKLIAVYGIDKTTEVEEGDPAFAANFIFALSGTTYQAGPKPAGGLRVKKMTDFDPVSQVEKVKNYEYKENGLSSGRVSFVPEYRYDYNEVVSANCGGGADGSLYTYEQRFNVYTSFSNAPLTQMQGGYVGYGKVTVYNGINSSGRPGVNGKSEHFFRNMDNNFFPYPEEGTTIQYLNRISGSRSRFPFGPAVSEDWRRGFPTTKIEYQNKGLGGDIIFSKVKETINTYKDNYYGDMHYPHVSSDVVGAKIGISKKWYVNGGLRADGCNYKIQYYFIPSRVVKLIKTEVIEYDKDETVLTSRKSEYHFENLNHLELSRKEEQKSNGEVLNTHYLYPEDYSNLNDGSFIDEMKKANMVGFPVEIVNYKTDITGSNAKILSGVLNTYNTGSKLGLIDEGRKLESENPIDLTGFKFSNQTATGVLPQNGAISAFSIAGKDYRYPAEGNLRIAYDDFGNVTHVEKNDGVPVIYLWSYNNAYPVAQITGVDYEELKTVLPTSFIPDLGSLTDQVSINTQIATLRDRVNANNPTSQIKTFAYLPLVGLISVTDENGFSTSYRYGDFGRLQRQKDTEGNIVKTYEYNYSTP